MFSSNDRRRTKKILIHRIFPNPTLTWTTSTTTKNTSNMYVSLGILHAEATLKSHFLATKEEDKNHKKKKTSMIECWELKWRIDLILFFCDAKRKYKPPFAHAMYKCVFRIIYKFIVLIHQNGYDCSCIFLGFYFERIIECAFMRIQRTKIDRKNRSPK